MMRLIGFFVRLACVVALVVWLADRPGTAQIVWRDYVIDTSAAVLGVIVLALAYAAVLLHRVWRFVWDGPRFWRLNRTIGKMKDGQTELARGLAALAAGQAAEAGRHAVKARKALGETPITRLIQAQAAQLAGDKAAAKSLFEALTQDEETAALGYRGLIMGALRDGAYDEAARLVDRLAKTKADAPWVHLVRFELGARGQNWGQADEALGLARKTKLLLRPQADKQEAALLLARAQDAFRERCEKDALAYAEKARKLAPDWLPAALLLAEAQLATGHEWVARRTVEKAWAHAPHPQLVELALRTGKGGRPLEAFKQIEKLTRGTQDKTESLMALAEAALKADLWGEARRFLTILVQRGDATQATFQALARLERREKGDESLAASWLARAVDAPPDSTWLCGACGAAHRMWSASCPTCGAFNAMAWGVPGHGRSDAGPTPPSPLLTSWG